MKEKKIEVHYDKSAGEFLVLFYEHGIIKDWKIVDDSRAVLQLLQAFYGLN